MSYRVVEDFAVQWYYSSSICDAPLSTNGRNHLIYTRMRIVKDVQEVGMKRGFQLSRVQLSSRSARALPALHR